MERASANERPTRVVSVKTPRSWFGKTNVATAAAAASDIDAESLLAFASESEKTAAPKWTPPPPARSSDRVWMAVAAAVAAVTIGLAAAWPMVAKARRAAAVEEGRLSLTSTPVGARVLVDGVERGTTPLSTTLAVGNHTIVVRQGDEQKTIPVTVAAGEQMSQYFEFAPPRATVPADGRLSITTDRAGSRVTLDGKAAGATPIVLADVAPGDHTVAVITDAGTLERKVKVEAGTTTSVVFSAPQSGPNTAGWVAVSAPFEVQIFQDADLVGSSAASKIMMAAGRHDVRFVNTSLEFEEKRSVDVAAGKTNAIKLAAPNAAVSINARPWADVIVDGSPIGQTPLANVSLAVGTHQITFRHPQFGERRQSAVVTVGGPNRISADLTKQ